MNPSSPFAFISAPFSRSIITSSLFCEIIAKFSIISFVVHFWFTEIISSEVKKAGVFLYFSNKFCSFVFIYLKLLKLSLIITYFLLMSKEKIKNIFIFFCI